jgi:hypothetical protein
VKPFDDFREQQKRNIMGRKEMSSALGMSSLRQSGVISVVEVQWVVGYENLQRSSG